MLGRGRPIASDALLSARLTSLFFYPLVPLTRSLPSIHAMRSPASSELKEAAAGSSAASSAPDQRRLRRRRWPEGAPSRASRPGCRRTRLPHFSPEPSVHRCHASLRGRPADAQSCIPHAAAPCGGWRSCSRAPVELCDEAAGVEPPRTAQPHPRAVAWAAELASSKLPLHPWPRHARMRRTCLLFFLRFFLLQLLYIGVVTMLLTCCNPSSSGCNCFSFMSANRCSHVASVFLRCCKCLMRMFQN
jgi:hypothetical protein